MLIPARRYSFEVKELHEGWPSRSQIVLMIFLWIYFNGISVKMTSKTFFVRFYVKNFADTRRNDMPCAVMARVCSSVKITSKCCGATVPSDAGNSIHFCVHRSRELKKVL